MQRFWDKVRDDGFCWTWTASRNRDGYGQFKLNGKVKKAHRVAYELLKGPIPDGLDLDHLCRNRSCVNPGHLEPVTRRENVLRGVGLAAQQALRTHCPKDHEYTEGNTRRQFRAGRVSRSCRACHCAANRKLYASKKS